MVSITREAESMWKAQHWQKHLQRRLPACPIERKHLHDLTKYAVYNDDDSWRQLKPIPIFLEFNFFSPN